MKKEETIKKKQEELDSEQIEDCPKCGSPRFWDQIREVGCLECYYRENKKRP